MAVYTVLDLPMDVRMEVARVRLSQRLRIFDDRNGPGFIGGFMLKGHYGSSRFYKAAHGSSKEECALQVVKFQEAYLARHATQAPEPTYCNTCGERLGTTPKGNPSSCPRCPNIIKKTRRRRSETGVAKGGAKVGSASITNSSAEDDLLTIKKAAELLDFSVAHAKKVLALHGTPSEKGAITSQRLYSRSAIMQLRAELSR